MADRVAELVDLALKEAQERGDLKAFNQAYSCYRRATEAAGLPVMHYRTAQKRLRLWVYSQLKEGAAWGVDRPMLQWVFRGPTAKPAAAPSPNSPPAISPHG